MRKTFVESGLIIPLILGFFSMIGLCVVVIYGVLINSRQAIPPADTETPFHYIYLGTEPGALEPTLEETATPLVTKAARATKTPKTSKTPRPSPIVLTALPTNTSVSLFTNTPSRTPTPASTATPGGVNIYDDTDFRLVFSGNWVAQSNLPGAYQGTLHVSDTVGDSVTFTFVGQQIKVRYQAGPSLGTVTITLDSLGFDLSESESATDIKQWVSGALVRGTHTVVITHVSGGSVNIDSISITDTLTPTPTSTP